MRPSLKELYETSQECQQLAKKKKETHADRIFIYSCWKTGMSS